MRELTKSLIHCSWALSIFSVHQLRNAALQRSALQIQEFAEALDNIADAACRDLSPGEMNAYRIGTSIQDGVVDLVFKGIGRLSAGAFNGAFPARSAASVVSSARPSSPESRDARPSMPAYAPQAPMGHPRLYITGGA